MANETATTAEDDPGAQPGHWAADRVKGGLRILLADDARVTRVLAARLLAHDGHEVDAVEDGRQALNAALARDYDLVLMDMHMPVMDGCEAAQAIRRAGCPVAILALTATASEEDQQVCLAAGMNGFLRKPFMLDQFHQQVQRVLGPCGEPDRTTADPGSRAPVRVTAERFQ